MSDKWNTAPSRIVEGSPKIIFPEIVEKSDSGEQMNLANSLGVQTPKLVLLRHPLTQTENLGDRRDGSVATRVADQDEIWRPTDRDVRTAPTHGDVESISEKLAHRKFIKDSEFETREVFERENIKNIETRLETTRLDDQMTQSVNISKPSETLIRHHLIRRIHRHQTQHQRKRNARRRKSVVSIKNMICQTHLRAMILIRPMTAIIDVNDAKIRNTRKRIRSDYAQLNGKNADDSV